MKTYTYLDWNRQRHTVDVPGRLLESDDLLCVFLSAVSLPKSRYVVHYGLQVKYFYRLSDAAKEYENCLEHAKSNLCF